MYVLPPVCGCRQNQPYVQLYERFQRWLTHGNKEDKDKAWSVRYLVWRLIEKMRYLRMLSRCNNININDGIVSNSIIISYGFNAV
jgi:recombinational DNA repair protein (RecF pathway)